VAVEILIDANSIVFVVERQHGRNAGLVGVPVSGTATIPADDPAKPGPAIDCEIVRLHDPIETMTIKWTAVKEGAAPLVPNPYLFDRNLVFESGQRTGAIPVRLVGYAGHAWSMTGIYKYIVAKTVDLNSDFPLGLQPWDASLAMSDAYMPAANFVNSILETVRKGEIGGSAVPTWPLIQ
jgi:hypothetical protein